jgi:hypothetical protein
MRPDLDADEEQPQVLDGPDPREWPVRAIEAWNLMLDIETWDRISAAMNGPIAQDHTGPAYGAARRFLASAGGQLRTQLGEMICQLYGVPVAEEDDSPPFAAAGRPRAFGAEAQPPPAT